MKGRLLTTVFLLLLVLNAALFAAGCGSSSEGAPLTKAQFIKQGDAICKKVSETNEEDFQAFVQRAQTKGGNEKDAGDIGREVVLPHFEAKVAQLTELEPPRQGEEQIVAWFDALEETVEEAQKDPSTLLGFASSADPPLIKANRIAREYGLDVCGEG